MFTNEQNIAIAQGWHNHYSNTSINARAYTTALRKPPSLPIRPRMPLTDRLPSFSSDTGSIGNLMSIPFQTGIGAVRGAFRGLRYGFDGGAYKVNATSSVAAGLNAGISGAQVGQRTTTAFGASVNEMGRGIGTSLGLVPDARGQRHFSPIKATGETLGGTAQLTTQTATSAVRAAALPVVRGVARGAWSTTKYVASNAPAAIGSVATGVATAGVTLGAAAFQTSKDLFNFMFESKDVLKGNVISRQYGLSKTVSQGVLPAYMVGHGIYGMLKGATEAKLGFIQAGEMPNMLHNEENKTRSQRKISPLTGLDDIAGINFALHKLR